MPFDEKKAMWEEGTRTVIRMMTETPFTGIDGDYVQFPERNVIPKPLQKPHPPIWVASGRRETILAAARLGIGSLGFSFETPDEAQERVDTYYRIMREECLPIGKAVNPGLAVLSQFAVSDTEEDAQRKAGDGGQFFSFSSGNYYNPIFAPHHKHGRMNLYTTFKDSTEEELFARFQARSQDQLADLAKAEIGLATKEPESESQRALFRSAQSRNVGVAIGTQDQVREAMKAYEEAHQDVMLFIAQCGTRKHEDIMDSIDRFGRHVLPEFKERHEEIHRPWRERQLQGFQYEVNSSI